MLDRCGDFASLSYRDMPFVMSPTMWATLFGRWQRRAVARARLHADGVDHEARRHGQPPGRIAVPDGQVVAEAEIHLAEVVRQGGLRDEARGRPEWSSVLDQLLQNGVRVKKS